MTPASAGTARSIATWVLRALLGLAFLVIGAAKLASQAQTVQLFAAIGWGQWFRYLTGALDLTGALLVLSPWMPFYGAVLLGCTVGTAVVLSLARLHNNPAAGVALFALAVAVAWLTHPRRVSGGDMFRRSMLVLALLGGVPPSSAVAQGAIGVVQIQLGASKAATLASLQNLYRVERLTGSAADSWTVFNRDGPPFRLLGSVSFEGDTVNTISRSWNSSNDHRDPDEIARVVVGALRALADGTGSCLVQEILDRTNPEFMSEGVRVLCGAHAIEMTASSSGGRSNSIDVNEVWRLGPPRY